MPAKRRLLCKRNRAAHGDPAHRSCDRPANAELQPVHIASQLNHAHADFWLSERGEGQRAVGPKYSVNVLGGQNVWLYKPGAPGRDLGILDRCGPDAIQTLLQDAAEEFGRMAR